jgi:tetratricopeptide (TPR) repeat protein
MKRLLALLLVVAAVGCQGTLCTLDQSPPGYMQALETAQAVLARHYGPVTVDKARGTVEASTIVRANLFCKYRTKAAAQIVQTAANKYDAVIRVTNELEVSEPSLLGGGQPGYDWRAVGFDQMAEAALLAEYQGQTPMRPSPVMFRPAPAAPLRHRDLPRPEGTGGGGAEKPMPRPSTPRAPEAKPEEAPRPSAAPAAKPSQAQLFEQHLMMGDLHLKRRDLDNAVLEYQRATSAAPTNAAAHLSLAGVFTALRHYSAGAAELRQAASAANGDRLPAADLSRLRGPADEVKERILLLKGWCKQKPEDTDARLLLAYHCFLAGRVEDARATLDEVMKANPKDLAGRYLVRQMEAQGT